jgi:folylpolyglutamate synthase/dihydropteroate synthase
VPNEPEDVARAFEALVARGPGRMVPDLSRITALTELLGDPQLAYPTVHVTGTNGKGSVVRMIGALCSAAGLAAGTYTSPHLQTIRERLSIAGRHISARRFAEVYDEGEGWVIHIGAPLEIERTDSLRDQLSAIIDRRITDAVNTQTRALVISVLVALVAITGLAFGLN